MVWASDKAESGGDGARNYRDPIPTHGGFVGLEHPSPVYVGWTGCSES